MGTLRLLLAFAVVIAHTKPIHGFIGIGGTAAVKAFFVISGFYMHLVLDTKYAGRPALFYLNRALRLYPVYALLLMLMAAFAVFHITYLDGGHSDYSMRRAFDGSPGSLLALVPNFLIVGADWVRLFLVNTATGELSLGRLGADMNGQFAVEGYLFAPQMWSVSNEIAFYLVAPFIARLRLPLFTLALAAAWLLFYQASQSPLFWRSLLPQANFIFFALGMAAYRLMPLYRKLPRAALLPVAAIAFACLFTNGELNSGQTKYLVFVWLPYILSIPALFLLSQRGRVDRFIGDLSYPVYVSHYLFAVSNPQGNTAALIVMALATAFAVVAVLAVDRPVERLRHALSR